MENKVVQTAPHYTIPANQQQGAFVLMHRTGGSGRDGGESSDKSGTCQHAGLHALSGRDGRDTVKKEKV